MADINGDGIPDMLVADQGSNDVSVIFGSYDAHGDWVGIAGPRLKSGGDGPIAVIVQDSSGNGVPDLAVVNGGSGTVTLLPGVGRGFFDDQQPRTLFNLGSAVVQPPTFAGDSGLGYVVTAGGDLVRFDLSIPRSRAAVVFSGQQVVAAQALAERASRGGPRRRRRRSPGARKATALRWRRSWQAQGGVPTLPSAIDVVSKPSGQFDVLVSSQGSDTIFVFAQVAASSEGEGRRGSPGELVASVFNSFRTPTLASATAGEPSH